jgi:site-specific DNA-methyltransferase (adenine-specific)
MAANPGGNQIVQGDCVQRMMAMPAGQVDLAFADPPFNIGYEYDVYRDKKEHGSYLDWSRSWIAAVYRALKDSGTFWLAIGDEYAAELKLASQEIGFHSRSWIIWYYTFGVNCKNKFSRSHAHLFYFVKDPKQFTFRAEALENRIPSARQLVYADNRANPTGRLPDDTWVLRPQDLAGCFTTAEDTWYFPRVAGTFKERAGFHGCQMPEQLLGRIIKLCSEEADLVLDPFSGSATTLAVAKKLGRRYLGFELSPEYVTRGTDRLESICVGDPLDGAAEPTVSAPSTPNGKGAKKRQPKARQSEQDEAAVSPGQLRLFHSGLLAAYRGCYDGYSLDRVVADPALNERLVEACLAAGLPGEPGTWNSTLFRLRKAGRFVDLPTLNRTEFSWEECDPYLFASEIAWRQMLDQGCDSLDTILCNPHLAATFDEVARRWAPGFSSLEYRWAALKLRKNAKLLRSQAELLSDACMGPAIALDNTSSRKLPESAGVYVVIGAEQETIYAGETGNIRQRLGDSKTRKLWERLSECLTAKWSPISCRPSTRLAHQRRLVSRHRPLLNLPDPRFV